MSIGAAFCNAPDNCSTYTRILSLRSRTSMKRTCGVSRVACSSFCSTGVLPAITPYSAAGANWSAINWPVWVSSWRRSCKRE